MLPAGTRCPTSACSVQQLPVRPLSALHATIIPGDRTHCRQKHRKQARFIQCAPSCRWRVHRDRRGHPHLAAGRSDRFQVRAEANKIRDTNGNRSTISRSSSRSPSRPATWRRGQGRVAVGGRESRTTGCGWSAALLEIGNTHHYQHRVAAPPSPGRWASGGHRGIPSHRDAGADRQRMQAAPACRLAVQDLGRWSGRRSARAGWQPDRHDRRQRLEGIGPDRPSGPSASIEPPVTRAR